MTNADVSETNLGVTKVGSGWRPFTERLFRSHQSVGAQILFTSDSKRYNNTVNDSRVEYES